MPPSAAVTAPATAAAASSPAATVRVRSSTTPRAAATITQTSQAGICHTPAGVMPCRGALLIGAAIPVPVRPAPECRSSSMRLSARWRATWFHDPAFPFVHLAAPWAPHARRWPMNKRRLLCVLVGMQNHESRTRFQPLGPKNRRSPDRPFRSLGRISGPGLGRRGVLAAVLLGGLALVTFARVAVSLLLLLAVIAVLVAVVRRRRSGK
jgi:hypothetical protein